MFGSSLFPHCFLKVESRPGLWALSHGSSCCLSWSSRKQVLGLPHIHIFTSQSESKQQSQRYKTFMPEFKRYICPNKTKNLRNIYLFMSYCKALISYFSQKDTQNVSVVAKMVIGCNKEESRAFTFNVRTTKCFGTWNRI